MKDGKYHRQPKNQRSKVIIRERLDDKKDKTTTLTRIPSPAAAMLQATQFAAPSINIQGVQVQVSSLSLSFHMFLQVNLDFNTSRIISQSLQRPSASCFVTAQGKIFSLMENGSFPRFLQSENYRGLFHDGSGGKQKVFKTKSARDIIQCVHKPIILSWASAFDMLTAWTVAPVKHYDCTIPITMYYKTCTKTECSGAVL